MASHDILLPTYEELTVPQELDITTPIMKAAAVHMHKYCEPLCKEFMLCRKEEEDPRRCLKEGADVTNCGVKFLRKVKKVCRQEFERYAHCVDFGSAQINTAPCRKPQRSWDRCVFEHFGQERPPLGEFAKPHVHYTTRPKPAEKDREYKEAASKVIDELPADYPIRKDYKKYSRGYTDWLH